MYNKIDLTRLAFHNFIRRPNYIMELETTKSKYIALDTSDTKATSSVTQESNYNPLLPRRFVQKLVNLNINTITKYESEGLIKGTKYSEGHFDVVGYPITEVQKLFKKKNYSFKNKQEAEVICVWSQKGGVGKSSTTQHLASTLSLMGKVLVIDIDSQADSTGLFGGEAVYDDVVSPDAKLDPTIHELINWELEEGKEWQEDVLHYEPHQVIKKITPTLHMIPADLDLGEINYTITGSPLKERPDSEGVSRKAVLFLVKEVIEKVKNDYDYIVFDTPPSIEAIVLSCLMAANRILIPLELEAKCLRTMRRNENFLKRARELLPDTQWDKVLVVPNKFRKEKIKIKALGLLEQIYHSNDLITMSQVLFPHSSIIDKASDRKEPMYAMAFKHGKEYRADQKVAMEFTDYFWVLAHELLDIELDHFIFAEEPGAEA